MNRAQRKVGGLRRRSDSGQTMLFVLLVLGIFLLGAIGFGVDYGNFWFHRRSAQAAADAACTAGVMDLLSNANTGASPGLGRFPGGDFNCKDHPTAVPCQYAALNGYDGQGNYPGNTVDVSFVPTSGIPGIDPGAIPNSVSNAIRIDVIDHVQTFFSGLLTGKHTQDVHVGATCAVVKATAPIPLIVLNPTCDGSLAIPGNGKVAIVGGPSRSVEVNSDSLSATSLTGSGLIDLSHGGPSFSGSDFGSVGEPLSGLSGTFSPGSTGSWSYPVTPISDPYASVPPPGVPTLSTTNTAPISVGSHDSVYDCPDSTGCKVYEPGLYTNPIVVKGVTALFVPGLYYFNIPAGNFDKEGCGVAGCGIGQIPGQCNYALSVNSNGIIRTVTTGLDPFDDGSRGLTFYFSGPGGSNGYGSVFFGSNAGGPASTFANCKDNLTCTIAGRTIDNYDTTGAACPGGAGADPMLGLPNMMPGNILLGPCTQDGTYFSNPSNTAAGGLGPVRGMIFFADRDNGDPHGQPSMQGGGGLAIVGTMYFHNCPDSLSAPCSPYPTDYNAFLQFQGASGPGTFLLGNITTDQLVTGGGGGVAMQLNTALVYIILKATLIR